MKLLVVCDPITALISEYLLTKWTIDVRIYLVVPCSLMQWAILLPSTIPIFPMMAFNAFRVMIFCPSSLRRRTVARLSTRSIGKLIDSPFRRVMKIARSLCTAREEGKTPSTRDFTTISCSRHLPTAVPRFLFDEAITWVSLLTVSAITVSTASQKKNRRQCDLGWKLFLPRDYEHYFRQFLQSLPCPNLHDPKQFHGQN